MLRCVGNRARAVRRIFAFEGLVLAVAGWLLGASLGYLLAHLAPRLYSPPASATVGGA